MTSADAVHPPTSASGDRFRQLAEWAPVGIVETDRAGRVIFVNDRWREITGVTTEAPFDYSDLRDIVDASDRDRIDALLRQATDALTEFDTTTQVVRRDGESVPVRFQGAPTLGADGKVTGFVGSLVDLTELAEAQRATDISESRYRAVIDSLHDGLIVHDATSILTANVSAARILGVPLDRILDSDVVLGTKVYDTDGAYIPVDERPSVIALTTGEPIFDTTMGVDLPSGERRWFSSNAVPLRHEGRTDPYAVVLSFTDVTDRQATLEQNARLAKIVESTSDLVGVVDWTTGNLSYLNRAARELLGHVDSDITGLHYLSLFPPHVLDLIATSLEPALRRGDVWSGELPMCAADGSERQVWQSIAAERGTDGSITQLSAVARDVTDRRRFEEELAWRATHDPHTGLPNRALLLDQLEAGLEHAHERQHLIALLFLDLDRFKQVNDSLGHEAGDQLLVQAAARLTAVLRPSDMVARIGGDEFVVLAQDIDDQDHALVIGQRVAAAIDHAPFVLNDQSFDVTASIGIAISSGHDVGAETMLRDADAAMYRAKDLGRARLEVFDESMHERAERRNIIVDQLAAGIEHDEITVYYQPCIDLSTGRVDAVEALARWTHPQRGVLSPYEFIALAEDTGLIVGLGLSVLSKACHQAQSWQERFGPDAPRVHVNLSARQLSSRNLPALVEGVLQGTGLAPARLCLEITESVLMDDAASVIDTLWSLKAIGVSIAIDDFGTGYSSLSYLRRFPVDVLKVDQSFVDGLGPDPEDSAIVAAIISLAASLDLDAIAEGVETTEQLERLQSLGCHSAQGFLFSEPRPAAEIELLFGTTFTI